MRWCEHQIKHAPDGETLAPLHGLTIYHPAALDCFLSGPLLEVSISPKSGTPSTKSSSTYARCALSGILREVPLVHGPLTRFLDVREGERR